VASSVKGLGTAILTVVGGQAALCGAAVAPLGVAAG
jgi:hypothetical protein